MKWKMILPALIAGLLGFDLVQCDELIKRSEYNRMPPMFVYDQYDDCLFSDPEVVATYCMVRVVIKPDNGSDLWRLIKKFSSKTKMHLNHASLDRGVCITDVAETVAGLKVDNISALVVPKFEIGFPYIYGTSFRNVNSYKSNYSDLVAAIINKDLTEKYGLEAYTEIEYCDRTGVDEFPIDGLDIAFLVIVAILISVMIASSYYDASWKTTSGLSHYQKDLPSRKTMLLSSFSVIRNWYRLVSNSRDSTSRDLRILQAIRFLNFILTICFHIFFFVQLRTGWVIEQKYRELVVMLLINGTQVVTSFFMISAFVFTVTYVNKIKDTGRKPGIKEILVITINRYIRLTPVYALLLMFEATWLVRLQNGPFWRREIETCMVNCRHSWWINLLYLNNYLNPARMCMLHAWYLATDFQLSFIGLVVVTFIIRVPRSKVSLLTILTIVFFIVPGVTVYLGGYEGAIILYPEMRRFLVDEPFHRLYFSGDMYLGVYFTGVIGGFLYLNDPSASKRIQSNTWFRLAFYSIFIVGPAMFLNNRIFYENDYPKPSLWISPYFAGTRILWALILLLGLFGFTFRVNKMVTRVLNLKVFEFLGRLTYGAYVVHYFIVKMISFNVREPSNMTYFDMVVDISATLLLSYILSLALALLVEFPVSALQKQLLQTFFKPSTDDCNSDTEFRKTQQIVACNAKETCCKDTFKENIDFPLQNNP